MLLASLRLVALLPQTTRRKLLSGRRLTYIRSRLVAGTNSAQAVDRAYSAHDTRTRCHFNMRSKADTSQLNLPHGNRQLKVENRKKLKSKKTDMLRSIGEQSGESVESVPKKKMKAAVGRICRKGRF